MQEALDRKHRGLNETRDQLQEALRDSLHRQQMSMIDEEQALVERQLEEARQKNIVSSTGSGDSGQSTNSTSQGIAGSGLFLKDLTEVVRTLFGQSDSSTLPASKIADFYEKQCGRNLQLDADRRIGNADGSQMALKSIFERLSCCDVILSTDSGKKKRRRKAVLVRLVDQAPRFESEGVSNKVDSNVRYNKEEKDGMTALPTRRAGKCATDDLNSICVANISESTTEADLRNSFQSYGCLLLIDISKDEEGRHALVSFVSSKDAARAMEDLDGCPCGESTLKLEWAQSNASFKLTPPAKKAVNPGLSRRFQLENAFIFPDFDDSALIRILMSKARTQEIPLSLAVAKRAVRTLAKARAKPNFGNAGAVDNILSQAISRMQLRDKNSGLTVEDFDYRGDGRDEGSLETLFDDLIGCQDIRQRMEDLRDTVVFAKTQGRPAANSVGFNYLFLGSPGTGKTTVARKMGKMFESLGLLPSCELKEIKASDMLTGYVGQAGQKTRQLLRERGGVLFVDEAYQMDPTRGGSFMTEAVDELVGALTEEDFKGKLLVILAGYDQDMESMLSSVNPGMKSRFSERVRFGDFDANSTAQLLQKELEKREIPLEIGDLNDLCRLAQKLVDSDDFGNGRDVVTWADHTYRQVAKKHSRKVPVKSSRRTKLQTMSTLDDITAALDLLLSSRQVRKGPSSGVSLPNLPPPPTMLDTVTSHPPPQPVMATHKKVETTEEKEKSDKEDKQDAPRNPFEGMNEIFLQSLQDFIDREGLDSEQGIAKLSLLDPASQEFRDLLSRLVDATGMDPDAARNELIQWQNAQRDLKRTVEATKSAITGARPIWRCAVCGRADKPWIACYVAPFIVGYEQVNVGDE